jgi:hypothetical protein
LAQSGQLPSYPFLTGKSVAAVAPVAYASPLLSTAIRSRPVKPVVPASKVEYTSELAPL